MESYFKIRVKGLTTAYTLHRNLSFRIMFVQVRFEHSNIVQGLRAVGTLSRLSNLRVLQLMFSQDRWRWEDLVTNQTFMLPRRIVASLHMMLQFTPGFEVSIAVGASQTNSCFQVMHNFTVGMHIIFSSKVRPFADTATETGGVGSLTRRFVLGGMVRFESGRSPVGCLKIARIEEVRGDVLVFLVVVVDIHEGLVCFEVSLAKSVH